MPDWLKLRGIFDPEVPIPPNKIKDWYVERPYSSRKDLLLWLEQPKAVLLIGDGSGGRSTELNKLSAELQEIYPNYFIIQLQLDRNVPIIDDLTPIEAVYFIGAAICKIAIYKLNIDRRKLMPHMRKMTNIIQKIVQTHTENKTFEINPQEVIKNLVCMVAGEPTGEFIKYIITSITRKIAEKPEIDPPAEELISHINTLIEDIQTSNNINIVLLVDGFDKLDIPEAIELNFTKKRHLAQLKCRVVYSAPAAIYHTSRYATTRKIFPIFMHPNIRLYQKSNPQEDDEEGYNTMREIIEKRLNSENYELKDIIKDDNILNALILASGGIVREFIRLIQQAIVAAYHDKAVYINKEHAFKAIADLHRTLYTPLNPDERQILEEVHKTSQKTKDEDKFELLLRGHFIVSYFDPKAEEIWFDRHPILDDTCYSKIKQKLGYS
jgi:hypothetical protein